ncbi:hypothetical protein OHC33_004991 [Knufia fluminis]|uniref:ABM domain-containing protein n=1 Tax=Knufia fluminis TaxID=191047 RepID=A0AAN8IN01_9EURO|nr:hypothetical protein OHC33_004991 [Knufia fluminis]
MTTDLPDMQAVTAQLLAHTPKSSLDIPLTEIVVFKLLPQHTPPSPSDLSTIQNDFAAKSAAGEGVRRVAWGCSLDDPSTVIIMFDWRRIQDHWAFWSTPAFEPVMRVISTLFEPGRPLVRHYRFGDGGMLRQEWQRVVVFDYGEEGKGEDEMKGLLGVKGEGEGQAWKGWRGGFAADVGEGSWYCGCLGYESEEAMTKDDEGLVRKGETHLVKLTPVEA